MFTDNKATIQMFPLDIVAMGIAQHTQFPFKTLHVQEHHAGVVVSGRAEHHNE
jgi:hypothetical protein